MSLFSGSRRNWRHSSFVLAPCLLLTIACERGSQTPEGPPGRLVLDERQAFPLPETLSVTQGAIGRDGLALLWNSKAVFDISKGAPRQICSSHSRSVLSAAAVDGGTEFVVGGLRPAIVRELRGDCTESRIPEVTSVVGAVYTTTGWTLLVDPSDPVVVTLSKQGTWGRWRLEPPELLGAAIALNATDSLPLILAPSPAGFVLGTRTPPYLWTEVAEEGHPVSIYRTLPVTEGAGGGQEWVATGLLAVGTGFLEVLADLTSDERLLVLFDSTGVGVRASEIRAHIGFVAADSQRNKLYAIRRTDRLELVEYDWRWEYGRQLPRP